MKTVAALFAIALCACGAQSTPTTTPIGTSNSTPTDRVISDPTPTSTLTPTDRVISDPTSTSTSTSTPTSTPTSSPTPSPPRPSPPVSSSTDPSDHVTAALYRSKDGDGPACLAELDRADALDPRHADLRWMIRAQCEMKAGKCVEGRARFRTGLDNAPTQRHLRPDELDMATEAIASQNCPRKLMTTRERLMSGNSAFYEARQRHDGDFCANEGLAIVPLIDALPPPQPGAVDNTRGLAIGALHSAMQCAGLEGKCDAARTLNSAYFKLLATRLTPQQIDDAFVREFPSCK